jgi:hypothetical protein
VVNDSNKDSGYFNFVTLPKLVVKNNGTSQIGNSAGIAGLQLNQVKQKNFFTGGGKLE